jgi:hypothetical protein
MGFWDGTGVTADNLARLGPFVDGFVGTGGKYSVLNDAIASGWTRIILATGASLNANLTIPSGTSIIGLQGNVVVAGNFCLNVTGDDCYFEGFRISNNTGKGFYMTGARARFFRVQATNCLSHGFHFNATWGDHEMISCFAYANGGDGVRCEIYNYTRIVASRSQNNVGYGVNDIIPNAIQISCSLINGNTAGQRSGASPYVDASVKAV